MFVDPFLKRQYFGLVKLKNFVDDNFKFEKKKKWHKVLQTGGNN